METMIEKQLNKYIKYLIDIGLLAGTHIKEFKSKYNEVFCKSMNVNSRDLDTEMDIIYFKENVSNTLLEFFKSMNDERKKLISMNIYCKFIQKEDDKNNKRESLLNNIIKTRLLKTYLNKWSHSIKNLTELQKESGVIKNSNIDSVNNLSIILKNEQNKNIIENEKMTLEQLRNEILNGNKIHKKQNSSITIENKYEEDLFKKYNQTSYSSILLNENNLRKSGYENTMLNKNYNTLLLNNILDNNEKRINRSTPGLRRKTRKIIDKDYIDRLSLPSKNKKYIKEKTTEYLKEEEELKSECTFKPQINKSYSSYFDNRNKTPQSCGERLYKENKNRIVKREMELLAKYSKESKENTFQPKIYKTATEKKVNNYNFKSRLENFYKSKKNNMDRIMKEIEEDFNQKHPFIPKINSKNCITNISKIENTVNDLMDSKLINNNNDKSVNRSYSERKLKVPVYERLYEDNKLKIKKQNERVQKVLDEIKITSNNCNKSSKENCYHTEQNSVNNKTQTDSSKIVDLKKIEKLYNDYKIMNKKREQIKEKIDKEEGITFRPESYTNNKYFEKINQDFHEREKLFLERQQNYIEAYKIYLFNEENQNKKNYSYIEREKISNNVINRLYKEGAEKYKQKIGNTSLLKNNICVNDIPCIINNKNFMEFKPNEKYQSIKKSRDNSKTKEESTNGKSQLNAEVKTFEDLEQEPEPQKSPIKMTSVSSIRFKKDNYPEII